ncbi:MAG: hypothetical protein ACE5H9_13035 [Anaerolineae bacterium]
MPSSKSNLLQAQPALAGDESLGVWAGAYRALVLPLSALLFLFQTWLFKGFIIDDAYITFRFAQQFVGGNGLVYNPGERVEGYSNFLWLMLLVPFELAGLDLALVAKVLGILFSLLALAVTWRFSRLLSRRRGFQVIPPLLLAATASFGVWSVGGLETPLFTFLLTLSLFLFVREEREPIRPALSGVVFALLALARPEGLFFFGVVAAYRVFILWRGQERLARRDLARVLGFAAIFAPYFVWRFSYYGFLLPNTVYAKSLGLHPRALLEGVIYLYDLVRAAGGVVTVGLAVILSLTHRRGRDAALVINVLLAGYVVFILLGGGDWMPVLRFGVHILPLLYLLVQLGFERLYALLGGARWAAVTVVVLLLGQVGYLLGASFEQRFVEGLGAGPLVPAEAPLVSYLAGQVKAGDTLAVVSAGRIAYAMPLDIRVIDMVGLTDGHIAHLPVQLPGGILGRGDGFGKWDVDYVLAQQPRFVQMTLRGQDAGGLWQTNFTGTARLANDPRFRARYRLVTAPGVFGLFERLEAQ